jgi:hypothetical protein
MVSTVVAPKESDKPLGIVVVVIIQRSGEKLGVYFPGLCLGTDRCLDLG